MGGQTGKNPKKAQGHRRRKMKDESKSQVAVRALGKHLGMGGILLAIDPSSGSHGSQPAVAVFKGGQLIYGETIFIRPGADAHIRLNQLQTRLIELRDAWKPSAVAVEFIPPFINGANPTKLHMAVGVVMGVFGHLNKGFMEVPAACWQPQIKYHNADALYTKSDLHDAVGIGLWILLMCGLKPDYVKTYADLLQRVEVRASAPDRRGNRRAVAPPKEEAPVEDITLEFLD